MHLVFAILVYRIKEIIVCENVIYSIKWRKEKNKMIEIDLNLIAVKDDKIILD